MMKIGIVCPYRIDRPGGILEVAMAQYRELKKRGHQVKLITPSPNGKVPKVSNPDFIFLGNLADFRSPGRTTTQFSDAGDSQLIKDTLDKEDFDVLHFHEPWVPFLSRNILQNSSSLNVATFHSKVPEAVVARTVLRVVTPYLKSVLSYLDVLTAVSTSGAEYAGGLTEQPINIIPNGIDLSVYKPMPVKKNPKVKTILYVGRLEGRKGVRYLLRAYQLFEQKHPNSRLYIAGDGPERERLELLADDLNLKHARFLGFVSDSHKVSLLNQADIFCSPALFGESFGIVLLEAMATDTAVVAGYNSGYREVMTGPGSLSLVNPHDSDEFARRIELMLNQKEYSDIWHAWAKKYIRQFDYSKIVKQYEDLYLKSLKIHGKSKNRS